MGNDVKYFMIQSDTSVFAPETLFFPATCSNGQWLPQQFCTIEQEASAPAIPKLLNAR